MPLSGRHGDRHVAEDAGERDQPEDRQDPAERAPGEDQQGEAADGIERHPLAREGEAEQDADDGHRHPERPSGPPPAGPERGEHRVGGHDEQADVDVVHADPRLDEEHPVGQHEEPGQDRHEPASEQDPQQQVDATPP